MRADLLVAGDRRRQAHLFREADLRRPRGSRSALAQEGARLRRSSTASVQDKLFLPGLLKLAMLIDVGLLRPHPLGARRVRLLGVRGRLAAGRSARRWNYRKADGGGIILDMLCHWRYVLDNLFGEVKAVTCLGATHIPTRVDEAGKPYAATPTTRPTPPSSSRAA